MSTTDVVPVAEILPATRPPEVGELEAFRQLGRWLSLAEDDKNTEASKGAAAALRFALANMLGVSPTAALTELSFIHGRLNLSAQLVRALAAKHGYRVVRGETNDQTCTATLIDRATGETLGSTTYTIEDAQRAGLIRDRSSWKTAPQRMLWARASKRVVDDFAPEVSLGITTPEEEEEITLATNPPTVTAPQISEPELPPDEPEIPFGEPAPTQDEHIFDPDDPKSPE